MTSIGIIVGSTRPTRVAADVARWVQDQAVAHGGARFEIVDLKDYDLPHLDEDLVPALGQYDKPHTRRWAEKVGSLDGFVFVTPEYNQSYPAALKTAIDFIYAEWGNKAAAFVSYGVAGGARAVAHLRAVMGNLRVADVTSAVALSLYDDFVEMRTFRPRDVHDAAAKSMLDEVIAWSAALKGLRTPDVEGLTA